MRRFASFPLFFCVIALPLAAMGDEFILVQGGRIQGEWLNPTKKSAEDYRLQTEQGITITLPDKQVQEVILAKAAQREYERLLPSVRDTAEEQWKMAEWCRQQQLTAERKRHLQRVIELEPNHEQARRGLGHLFIGGEWTTVAAVRQKEGYVYYRGSWRTIQEVEIFETQAKRELAQKDWASKLRRWRADLDLPARAKQGYEQIAAIKSPDAVVPLSQMLTRETVRKIKMLYADVLANIQTAEAVAALVQCSLNDPDIEMFHYAFDQLKRLKPPRISEQYVTVLTDDNGLRVNRAALALSLLRDPLSIGPLIEALITHHTVVVGGRNGPGQGYQATFSGGGSDSIGTANGGSSFSSEEEPKIVRVTRRNEEVLTALTKITQADFGYDAKAWRFWHDQERKRTAVGPAATRRD